MAELERDYTLSAQFEGRSDDSPVWAMVTAAEPNARLLSTAWRTDPNRPQSGSENSTPDLSWSGDGEHKRVYCDLTRAWISEGIRNEDGVWSTNTYQDTGRDAINYFPLTKGAYWAQAGFRIDSEGSQIGASFRMRVGWVKSDSITGQYSGAAFLNNLTWNNQPEIEWGPYQSYTVSSSTSSYTISPFTASSTLDDIVFVGYGGYPNGTSGYSAAELKAATKDASRAACGFARSRILVFEIESTQNATVRIMSPTFRLRFRMDVTINDFYVRIRQVTSGGTTYYSSGVIAINRTVATGIDWDFDSEHEAYTCIKIPWSTDSVSRSATYFWKPSFSETWTQIALDSGSKAVTVPANTFPRGTVAYYIQATDEKFQDALHTTTTTYTSDTRQFDTRPQFYISGISERSVYVGTGRNKTTISFSNRDGDTVALKLYRGNTEAPFYSVNVDQDSIEITSSITWFTDDNTITGDNISIRVVATNADNKSSEDSFTVYTAPYITQQPQSIRTYQDQTVTLRAEAIFGEVQYWWSKKARGDDSWVIDTVNHTRNYQNVNATIDMDGTQYRCHVQNDVGGTDSDIVTLTVVPHVAITSSPQSLIVVDGTQVSFRVDAVGSDLTYQWQYRTGSEGTWQNVTSESGNGAATNTLSVTSGIELSGNQYRCVVTDGTETAYSDAATLTVYGQTEDDGPPFVTSSPSSTTVINGGNAAFAVTATGASPTYQWQYRTSGSGTWQNVASENGNGATTGMLSFTADIGANGYQYRCAITNAYGTVYSDAATLTVERVLAIGTQPEDKTVNNGETASFYCVASYPYTCAYQWEKYDGSAWTEIQGATSYAYSVTGTPELNGARYRCTVSYGTQTVYSNTATLTVSGQSGGGEVSGGLPRVTSQPVSVEVDLGETALFAITAAGDDIAYQWQEKISGGVWNTMVGEQNASVLVTAEARRNGAQYRCMVSSAIYEVSPGEEEPVVYSDAATLTVRMPPVVSQHPQDSSVAVGETALFSFYANGDNVTYQWQQRTNLYGNWSNISGATSGGISVQATRALNGYQYRGVASNSVGTVYSDAATLTVTSVTSQPQNQAVISGTQVTFSVTASGTGLTYQWQYRIENTGEWHNITSSHVSGATANMLSFTADTAMNGYQYRCMVTDSFGTVYSDAATLAVGETEVPVPEGVEINATNFPDDVFRGYVSTSFDTDQNGYLSSEEAAAVHQIAVPGSVTSLVGIEYFTAIESLYCVHGGSFSTIDLSHNTALKNLCINESNISNIDISMLTELDHLNLDNNALTSLDCHSNAELVQVYCSNNNISSLNIRGLQYLRCLAIRNNRLSSVDLTGDPLLTDLIGRVTPYVETETGTGSQYTVYRGESSEPFIYCDTSVSFTGVSSPVVDAPAITSQPQNRTVSSGTQASFSVTASGSSLSYQWQYRTNGNGSWGDISGANSASLSVTGTGSMSGYQYRCVVSNSAGSISSNAATLTVLDGAAIVSQPQDVTVGAGKTATFSVTASGSGLSYQWQYRTSASGNWQNASGTGSATSTLRVTATSGMSGYQYRCVVSNIVGTVYSDAAALTVIDGAEITAHPQSQTVSSGTDVSFSITATGNNLGYQWQERSRNSSVWSNSPASGATTDTLYVAASDQVNGTQYRCAVTNEAGTAYSNAATLTVLNAPTITKQPKSTTISEGRKASFSITATGEGLSYQWQEDRDGAWENVAYRGATTNTMVLDAEIALDGVRFRCVVSNLAGSATSEAATLSVAVSQFCLQNGVYLTPGEYTFSVSDESGVVRYDLGYDTDDGTEWIANGASGATSFRLGESRRIKILLYCDENAGNSAGRIRPMLEKGSTAHAWTAPAAAYDHDVANDFNYGWLSIGNRYGFKENVVTATMPCTMTIRYRPIWRDTL